MGTDVCNRYLQATEVVDWQDASIRGLAEQLAEQAGDETALVKSTFEWVRDNIQHCIDFRRREVTCCASDVLRIGTGFCYAKSHLLAALLRANGIPTGFCYQRLSVSGDGPPFCLHGLNGVYLKTHGWYRVDARGNSESVHAEYCPPTEKLAFPIAHPEEADLPEIWADPLPLIVQALNEASSASDLTKNLPDVPIHTALK